ncbi:hypothetical protein COW36_19920 [bacterium (Candidatus Blackallbacteria) CG17_big_fil_post_rev_8_21_14_2_50_48_46]|uniref:Prolyl 4-hydroxylase alpha subunit Fe(2+) 2OG dioxygenase domain-containing protein n=1 Tax=bacterium (Candidatus Blackallbacteria) CG17_big_fil_post_rev_8_21_14_2_50_48_46 TaxID=2014261 RepID=A0A2M7G027_9BACT|nr:MAG: hypothetical protein COW64_15375 [bacterium (Candidatus Blackallbacteria) CG18_big_fil_WC_8_21_14_2_50_49_26]PIW14916.1 MAG: hypothetical protein COW36_19920 [bacterium (Candidatus Blackallbacteria) CG17_big_fil_post_rev_8_21_14_2_50_48_46]PIW44296.1 MAG: hypothetical protein COW20_24440 [bacterium (Candidatus Blackallbacteria) CG13_big_fil_rev_8_21_14_2_50_49_14]
MNAIKLLYPGLNAYTLAFQSDWLEEIRASFAAEISPFLEAQEQAELFVGGRYLHQPLKTEPCDYALISYDTWPLYWFPNHSPASWQIFHRFFEKLKLSQALKGHLHFKRRLVMYAGFFVIGNRALEEMWHFDYRPGAQAMTLIAPLFELSPEHGHVLYQTPTQASSRYTYRPNQALIFGAGFYHSTEPYPPSSNFRVLFSLTFGSDDWQDWPLIKENIAEQSVLYGLPCGHLSGRCDCEERSKNSWFQRFKQKFSSK